MIKEKQRHYIVFDVYLENPIHLNLNVNNRKEESKGTAKLNSKTNNKPVKIDLIPHVIETFRYFDQRRNSKESSLNHLRESSKDADK